MRRERPSLLRPAERRRPHRAAWAARPPRRRWAALRRWAASPSAAGSVVLQARSCTCSRRAVSPAAPRSRRHARQRDGGPKAQRGRAPSDLGTCASDRSAASCASATFVRDAKAFSVGKATFWPNARRKRKARPAPQGRAARESGGELL